MELQEPIILYVIYFGLLCVPLILLYWKRHTKPIQNKICDREAVTIDALENNDEINNQQVFIKKPTSETRLINYAPGHKMEMIPKKELNNEEKLKELEIQKQQLERIFNLLKEVESMQDASIYIKKDSSNAQIRSDEYLKNTIESQIKLYGLH